MPADGFVGRKGHVEACCRKFETSPVAFLSVLVKCIRRDCLYVAGTHLGEGVGGGDFGGWGILSLRGLGKIGKIEKMKRRGVKTWMWMWGVLGKGSEGGCGLGKRLPGESRGHGR